MNDVEYIRVRWGENAVGQLLSISQKGIALRSTRALPPGSCVEMKISLGCEENEVFGGFSMKVFSSKRETGESYLITGRPINLSREQRLHLEHLILGVRCEKKNA